jgi:hypothetical protein
MLEAVISLKTFLFVEWHYCKIIEIFFLAVLPHGHTLIQHLRTSSIFSLILKIIQISLLAQHLKEVVPKKSSIFYHTFVGSDRICFTSGFQ